MIRVCDDHGYFAEEDCPVCGNEGKPVLNEKRRRQLSKFISGALRHFPNDVGLSIDSQGWTSYDSLIDTVTGKYAWAESGHVEAVVATDEKGRFERRNDRIRAAYGHSIDVDLEATESTVPDRLYHGTDPEVLDSIFEEGLRPMSRQYVHLSETVEEARAVGQRHADNPVVLAVDANAMKRDGYQIDRRGEGTYTVERVPSKYVDDRVRSE
ncbi:RNA 2'-phosphotransferase [Haloprofundus halobius]|uniref:RNA 2'-phosphotransferase n=1 Tax=Haloprofundus halobius TaxID=2876194 RepID=UPI001CC92332|nr:RNA 2'-phosphotransferase [Haloprofundus halobius]